MAIVLQPRWHHPLKEQWVYAQCMQPLIFRHTEQCSMHVEGIMQK